MTVGLVYMPLLQFFDNNGNVLAGAKLFSFLANTNTPAALFADAAGVTPLPNPAIADSAGKLLAYAVRGLAYKLELRDSNNVLQSGWPIDNILLDSAVAPANLLPTGMTVVATQGTALAVDNQPFVTIPGFIVAGKLYLGCSVQVTQSFSTSHGLTSMNVGPFGATNLWGNPMGITVGSINSTNRNQIFTPTTTVSLVVTANGGNFGPTGQALITKYEASFA